MARIPTITSKVTPFAGGIDVQASPEAFGAQIGQAKQVLGGAIGQLGSAVGSVGSALMQEQKSQQRDVDNLAVATALASPDANFDKTFNDITTTNTDGNSLNPVSDAYMKHIDDVIAANPNMSAAAKQDLRLRMLQHAPVYNAAAARHDQDTKVTTGLETITEALDTQINSIRNGGGAETTTGLVDPKTGVVTEKSRYDIAIDNGVNLINAQPLPPATKLEMIKKYKSQAAAGRFDALMTAALGSKTNSPGLADDALNDFRKDPRWLEEMTRVDYDNTLNKLIETQKQSKKGMQARLKILLQRLSIMGNDPSTGLATPTMIADAKRMVNEYGDDEDQANLATIENEWLMRDKFKHSPNSTLEEEQKKIRSKAQPDIKGTSGAAAVKGSPEQDILMGDGDAQDLLMARLTHRNQPYYVTAMHPQLQNNLAMLIQSAPPEIRDNLVIVSGARSRGDQARVLAGRAPSSTVAGLNGPHVRGVAADLGWRGGRGTYLPPAVQQWLYQNAPRFGMKISPWTTPGNSSFEPWHIELVGTDGRRISANLRGGGGGTLIGGEAGDTLSVAAVATPVSYRPMFEATVKYGAGMPALLASMGAAESNFNPNANSGEAYGLMQFTPETARRWNVNSSDPASSIDGAGRLMQHLMAHYAGKSKGGYDSTALAVAAYNAGENRVDMWLIGKATLPGETKDYVVKVFGGQAGALAASETGVGNLPRVASGDGYISWDQFVQLQTYSKMIAENNAAMKDDFMTYAASKGEDIAGVVDPTTGSLADDAAFAQRSEDYGTAVDLHNPLVSAENPYANPLTKDEAGAMVTIANSHDEARQLELFKHMAVMDQPTQDAMLHQIGQDSADGRVFAYAGAIYPRDRHLAAQMLHGRSLLANRELDFIKSIGGSELVDTQFRTAAGGTLAGMSVDAQGVLKGATLALFAANAKPGTKTPTQEDMDKAFADALGMQKTMINGADTLIPKDMDPQAVNKTYHALDIEDFTKASINGKPPLDADTGQPMSAEDMTVAGTMVPIDTKGHYKIVMEDGRIVVSRFPKNEDDNGEAYVFTLTPELIKSKTPAPGSPDATPEPPQVLTATGNPLPSPVEPMAPLETAPAGSMPPSALPTASPAPAPVTSTPAPAGSMPPSALPSANREPIPLPAEPVVPVGPAGEPPTPFIPPYASTSVGQPPQPKVTQPTGETPYQPLPATRAGFPAALVYGPGSGTGSGPASPMQMPSSEGIQGLDLTEQEQHLYQYHVDTLTSGKAVVNQDGSTSTVYQASVPHKGKWFNIPRVWDGKIVSEKEAVKRAATKGWNYWPSYPTLEDAQARYDQMHAEMEKDITAGENTSPQPQPPNPYLAPAVPISPTGTTAIMSRAQKTYHDTLLSIGVEEGSDEMKELLRVFDEANPYPPPNPNATPELPPSFMRPY